MNFLQGNGRTLEQPSENPRRVFRDRDLRHVRPACESLEGRLVLSTGGVLPAPPPGAVAAAAAELNAVDPLDFAQFQKGLSFAAKYSQVTPAQAGRLAQAETALDQAINSSGLNTHAKAVDINQVRDTIDHAFLDTAYRGRAWSRVRQSLHQDVAGDPGATQLVNRAVGQMQVIARAVQPTGKVVGTEYLGAHTRHVMMPASFAEGLVARGLPQVWQNLENTVTTSEIVDPYSVASQPDPVSVYYAGQVNSFVKG
ncbi:MAG: hypothetical protein ACYC61_29675 [Isosphaeraceae bacterium]